METKIRVTDIVKSLDAVKRSTEKCRWRAEHSYKPYVLPMLGFRTYRNVPRLSKLFKELKRQKIEHVTAEYVENKVIFRHDRAEYHINTENVFKGIRPKRGNRVDNYKGESITIK